VKAIIPGLLANPLMFRTKRLDPGYKDNSNVNVLVAGPGQVIFEQVEKSKGAAPHQGARPLLAETKIMTPIGEL